MQVKLNENRSHKKGANQERETEITLPFTKQWQSQKKTSYSSSSIMILIFYCRSSFFKNKLSHEQSGYITNYAFSYLLIMHCYGFAQQSCDDFWSILFTSYNTPINGSHLLTKPSEGDNIITCMTTLFETQAPLVGRVCNNKSTDKRYQEIMKY